MGRSQISKKQNEKERKAQTGEMLLSSTNTVGNNPNMGSEKGEDTSLGRQDMARKYSASIARRKASLSSAVCRPPWLSGAGKDAVMHAIARRFRLLS